MAEEQNKVCPKCGTQLVGKNNYCMGCGVNVNLDAGDGSPGKDGKFVQVYGNGTGYGNEKEYLERLLAAQKRREKKRKKNILSYGGMTSFLFIILGITLGVVIGLLMLRKSMEPKDQELTFRKDRKVTEIAGVTRIDPPKAQEFEGNVETTGTIDKRKKPEGTDNGLSGPMGANEESSQKSADPARQFFHGTMSLQAKGSGITQWEEREVWDVKGLDPNSVSYVVNHLNYQYEKFQNVIFVDCEITQTEEEVVVWIVFRNLDVSENVIAMVDRNLIDPEVVVKSGGKTYVSLRRVTQMLENSGWKQEGQESETTVIYVE